MSSPEADAPGVDIAVVGMSGRFPGAPDPDALWRRIASGDDCLTDLDPNVLLKQGVPKSRLEDPAYVRRAGVLDDVAGFDAEFFGISARDAALMDPQHRHFLECAWSALEAAGHTPEGFPGAIGVFAGSGPNTYLLHNLLADPGLIDRLGWFTVRHTGNDKDFLSTGVSYRLNLRGPSVNVQTACSTSLVAVHLAVQSLLAYECDLALAGGVTIEFPHGRGYLYQEGEILSPEGRCRAFDASSGGTVLTSGVGVVALRRLSDALADRDPVLAVIRGTAVNNDGARKVSFFAPSVDGHAEVVREALGVAGISARDIQLLEAHGTGTAVGDPIEVAALTEAFRSFTEETGFCRLTSTKPNIGHLDTAAGVASLIKVIQALRHRTLPPLANHTAPSPLLELDQTPFRLSSSASPWPAEAPRRAGVSSLGVGGTNAHVVVEEAPEPAPCSTDRPPWVTLALSARTPEALDAQACLLAERLDADPGLDVADVAHTLSVGRRAMRERLVLTVRDRAEATELLARPDPQRTFRTSADAEPPGLVFMFPGGGSQYPGMGAGLDARFSEFHAVRAEGARLVRAMGGPDLERLWATGADAAALRQPTASLPAVFLTSLGLARQWMALGAAPSALIGHSLGEYACATLAGVMAFEDALGLVMTRARLMEETSAQGAAMLVAMLGQDELAGLLPSGLSLAAVNAPDECVVAGPSALISEFASVLEARGAAGPRLPLGAAAHCSLLDPVLPQFRAAVEKVRLQAPQIPMISNLTGDWARSEDLCDPAYWVDHLRGTVRFADGLARLLKDGSPVLVELGPGQALSSYARRARPRPGLAIPALRHPGHDIDDVAFTQQAFARQWAAGCAVDLCVLSGEGRRKVPLPTYPFQHKTHWIAPPAGAAERLHGLASPATAADGAMADFATPSPAGAEPPRISVLEDQAWVPAWKALQTPAAPRPPSGDWLLVADQGDRQAEALCTALQGLGARARIHHPGQDPGPSGSGASTSVVFAPTGPADLAASTRRWFEDLVQILEAAGAGASVFAVTREAQAASGPATRPCDALALGPVLAGEREYPHLSLKALDVEADELSGAALLEGLVLDGPTLMARRSGRWLAPHLTPAGRLNDASDDHGFVKGGHYLITGGLGGVGAEIAAHLASAHDARLSIIVSRALPRDGEQAAWLAAHGLDDPVSRRILQLQRLRASGARIETVAADLADPDALSRALDEAESRLGRLDGAVHAAGVLRDRLIALSTPDDIEAVVAPKAGAALRLQAELGRRGAGLLVLVSSTSTLIAPPGQAAYVGANAVLDALCGEHGGLSTKTINYGLWAGVGMASRAARRARTASGETLEVAHPVFAELTRTPQGESVLWGRLEASAHWVVDEHRTAEGAAVLPGAAHLALMLAAAELAGAGEGELFDVTLMDPLQVDDDAPREIRLTIGPPGERRWLRLESAANGEPWALHSEAAFSLTAQPLSIHGCDAGIRLEALMQEPGANLFDPLERPRRRLALGPRWNCAARALRAGQTAMAELVLPGSYAAETGAWRAHPALLDVATALGVSLADAAQAEALYVPAAYRRVRIRAPLPERIWVRARREPGVAGGPLVVNLSGLDAEGRTVMEIGGLELVGLAPDRRLARTAPSSGPHGGAKEGARPLPRDLSASADAMGLTGAEGAALLERLVRSRAPRLVGSSQDPQALAARIRTETAAGAETCAPVQGVQANAAESAEDRLAAIWGELLGISDIDRDADFFELGGHSLIAVRLMARLRREFGVRLQLSELFEAPSVRRLAGRLNAALPNGAADRSGGEAVPLQAPEPRQLVAISSKGDRRPLFIVHGAGGNVLFLAGLARAMPERPIYGFQARGVVEGETPDASIAQMAERYVEELRTSHQGPYLLGGFSGGGLVALEMVRRLSALGETVDKVVLFDSAPPGRLSPPPVEVARNLAGHLLRRGPGPLAPFLKATGGAWLRDRLHAAADLTRPLLGDGVISKLRGLAPRSARWRTDTTELFQALGYSDGDHGLVALDDHFASVAMAHELGRYDVDTALIRADLVWPTQPCDYGWGASIEGRISLHAAPGDHNTMFYPENAEALAQVLQEALQDVDGEG